MGDPMKMVDGVCFRNMVEYAVRNLNRHVQLVNRLNVFPVPDGDTGTNMVTTIYNGLRAVDAEADLPTVSRKFARSVVFEARGNSGVIISQFLKGFSEKFYDVQEADGRLFISALENGVRYAYLAVAVPVEGTMLTVLKDATAGVSAEFDGTQTVETIVSTLVEYAKVSLENTPQLLAVLKESGVVDSGGAGVVYLFEGMKLYLQGEKLPELQPDGEETETVDYDAFHRDSVFAFGYCTQLLLQLLNGRQEYDPEAFKAELQTLGDSLVLSWEEDKVRLHIHTRYPEKIFALCHRYGEFLSCKIENMSVQHTEMEQPQRILSRAEKTGATFGVVAVAGDPQLQNLFLEMGADVALCCPDKVSTKDYLEAFRRSEAESILVFPNSADAMLTAMQAKKMAENTKVKVLNSRTVAECYAALPTIDYEEKDLERVADGVTEVLSKLYVASIARGNDGVHYKDMEIGRNAYYAFSGKELLVIAGKPEVAAAQTIVQQARRLGSEIITVFYRGGLADTAEAAVREAKQSGLFAEFFTVPVESLPCLMTLSFE